MVIGGSIPQTRRVEVVTGSTSSQVDSSMCGRWKNKVYTRKNFRSQTQATEVVPVSTSEQCPSPLVPNDVPEIVDVSSTSETEIEGSSSADLPIALRKDARAKAGVPPPRYGFENDISNYVSYTSLSPSYR